ncbi:hypothetical protein Tco_0875322 [Tanacetum coccineum]|uniref:Myb-like domain-containing protein n=1 Tax=Tanacetum coccineum TaxID=301880 RepID=A0ABQ5BPG7_9ASTR
MLHGQSPPVNFTHGGIQYLSLPNPCSVPWYTQQAQNQIYRPQRASPPPSQSSLIPAFNLDDDNFEPLWASASQPFQLYSEGPSQLVENDSLVEEVEPVQPKQKYTRRSKPTKKNDKEFVEPWTIEDEIALCKAFAAKSEDSVEGNGKKAAWIRPKVSQFCDPSLVDALLSKFTMAATPFFTQRKESSSEYLRIKERELELEERKRQEQGELERIRIA